MNDDGAITAEQLDALKHLSQTYRHLHDERRRYEVRFFIAILAVHVLAVPAFMEYASEASEIPGYLVVIVWGATLGLDAMMCSYLRYLHAANRHDIHMAEGAESRLARACDVKWQPQSGWGGSLAHQGSLILLVGALSAAIITVVLQR